MLRKFNIHLWFLIFPLVFFFSACVDDNSFFSEENTSDIVSSKAMVTVLNNFDSSTTLLSENEQCFRFVYPINLGYNNDSSVRIDNYAGLVDVISSQGFNFNITGLQFPIRIIFKNSDTEVLVANEAALLNILRECQFATVRDEFDRFFNTCFKFNYPVTLLNSNGSEVNIASDEEFQIFYQSQGSNYQPEFKFPIDVLAAPNFNPVTLNTYFEFYSIIESCEFRCYPELDFTFDVMDTFYLRYRFEADIPNIEAIESYVWLVNGKFAGFYGLSNQEGNILLYDFDAPGIYNVCIKVENDTCLEEIVFCKTIEVAESCPNINLMFDFQQEQGTTIYNFTASFDEISDILYEWIIDGQSLKIDGGANGDNILTFGFAPGLHNVCIKTKIPSCPNKVFEVCKEIMVEPICLTPFFTIEQIGNPNIYRFNAQFDGMDSVLYEWVIDGQVVDNDGGTGGDNLFVFEFQSGTYEICVNLYETLECQDRISFCETLVVN